MWPIHRLRLATLALAYVACFRFACSSAQENSCLPDGIPHALRSYLSVDSVEQPLGVWKLTWSSASLVAEVAMTLIKEVLGIHVEVTGTGSTSTTGLYATAGCVNPVAYANIEAAECSIESHAVNQYHVALETWGLSDISTMHEKLSPIPTVIPENAGSIGYLGEQGMYVFEKERKTIYDESGLAVEYYKSWDATWHEPWLYFDKITDVDPSLLRPCKNLRINDPVEMERYLLYTGDTGGVNISNSTGEVLGCQCWNDTWWVAPACRHDLTKCVPSITANSGWGMESNIQRASLLNMPVAFASADATALWAQLGNQIRGIHYWYTPDETFVASRPHQIIFPPYSVEEHMAGLRVSADVSTPLSKFMWNRLQAVAPAVRRFIVEMSLDEVQLNALLVDAAVNSSDSHSTVACRWLQANRAVWEPWIPSDTQCSAGLGLVNISGGYVMSLDAGATGCSFCPAGHFSKEVPEDSTRVCEECPMGSMQENPLQVECAPCPAGSFGAQRGLEQCEVCSEGSYQSSTGSSACVPCPAPAVTRLLAATTFEACVCPEGTYQMERQDETVEPPEAPNTTGNASDSQSLVASNGIITCSPCPGGMACEIDSRAEGLFTSPPATSGIPVLQAGYMSRWQDPLMVYKCTNRKICPGGLPGTCSNRRDPGAVACAKCSSGYYEDATDACSECTGWQTIMAYSASPFLAVFGLIVLAWAANKERIAEANASAVCAIVAGLTVSSIQTMSVLSSLDVTWSEPLKSCLAAFAVIGFDVKIIGLGCLVGGGSSMFAARQLLAPGLALVLAIITAVKRRFFLPQLDMGVHISNSVGSLFMLFFISIVLSALMPAICYKHPDGNGESMTSNPDILCFEGGNHLIMLVFSGASLAFVALPFFIFVLWATVSYPKFLITSQTRQDKRLRRFYFLYRRFEPRAYFYGSVLMTRSLCICLVPVVFRDNGAAHILILTVVISTFAFLQNQVRPWRGELPNALDSLVSFLIITVLTCGALTSEDLSGASATVSAVAHVCIALFLLVFCVSLTIALCEKVKPHPYFHRFVCHHKAAAAAQARLLQLLLQVHSRQNCFLDSDHLSNLDELFDVVRSKVGRLVVFMTKDVLRRPWCAGEVTTAYKAKVPTTRIVTEGFAPPSDHGLREPFKCYLHEFGHELTEAGIVEADLSAALKWVISKAVKDVRLTDSVSGTQRIILAAHAVLQGSKGVPAHRLQTPPKPGMPRAGAVLLSSHAEDEEAMAVAGILSLELQEWAMNKTSQSLSILGDIPEIASQTLPFASLRKMVSRSRATIVVLTSGSLISRQLTTILIATEAMLEQSGHEVVSLNTPEFRFPTEVFYENTLPQVLNTNDGIDAAEAIRLLQPFFKRISVAFTPHASMQIIKAEAAQVEKRVLLDKSKFDPSSASGMGRAPSGKLGTESGRLQKVTSSRGTSSTSFRKPQPPVIKDVGLEAQKQADLTVKNGGTQQDGNLPLTDKDPPVKERVIYDEEDIVFASEV